MKNPAYAGLWLALQFFKQSMPENINHDDLLFILQGLLRIKIFNSGVIEALHHSWVLQRLPEPVRNKVLSRFRRLR